MKIIFQYFFFIFIPVVVEGTNARANVGDFVLVEAANSPKFFAYVTVQRFTSKMISIQNKKLFKEIIFHFYVNFCSVWLFKNHIPHNGSV